MFAAASLLRTVMAAFSAPGQMPCDMFSPYAMLRRVEEFRISTQLHTIYRLQHEKEELERAIVEYRNTYVRYEHRLLRKIYTAACCLSKTY